MEYYLAHHGVKGQKHGVRQWQYPDGSLTPAGYIHYGVKPSTAPGRFSKEGRERTWYRKLAKEKYKELVKKGRVIDKTDKLSDSDKKNLGITDFVEKGGVLKKGSALYRVSTDDDKNFKNSERKYFSTSEYDASKWEREFVPQIADIGKKSSMDKYVTINDIKIASASKLGEEWSKLWIERNKDKSLSEIGKFGLTPFQRENDDIIESGYGFTGDKAVYDPFSNAGKKYIDTKLRDLAASNLLMTDKDTGSELIKRLKNQGYGGVADLNGIDVSYDPIIIFDPDESSKVISSSSYTKEAEQTLSKDYWSSFSVKYSEVKTIAPETRSGKKAIAKSLLNSGYKIYEIAEAMGLSLGQVDGLIYGKW